MVDDGSTDGGAEWVEETFGEKVNVIFQTHQGVSAARNNGVAHAKGDYIAFLDSDDLWEGEKLEQQVDFHRSNPQFKISQTQEAWIRDGKPVKFHKKYRKPAGDIFGKSLELCTVSPSSVFMERSLFNTHGGFDEAIPSCEDFDLWLRISCKEQVGLIDEPLMVKYGGDVDQLSSQYPAMDRFRIYALLKIWLSGDLNRVQEEAVESVVRKKTNYLLLGAKKRGRELGGLEELVEEVLNKEVSYPAFIEKGGAILLNEDLFS